MIVWVIFLIYVILFYVERSKIYKNLDENQKELLDSAKEKLKFARILTILVFCLVYVLLTINTVYNNLNTTRGVLGVVDTDTTSIIAQETAKSTVKNIWITIYGIEKYSLLAFVIETIVFKQIVKRSKKLSSEEKEVALKYYNGKNVSGVLLAIVVFVGSILGNLIISM